VADDRLDADGRKAKGAQLWTAALGLAWCALVAWSGWDLAASISAADKAAARELSAAAGVAEGMFLSERTRVRGELARLRTELRAEGLWLALAKAGLSAEDGAIADPPNETESDGETAPLESGRRGLEAALRRSLSAMPSLSGLTVVVAGPEGLQRVSVNQAPLARAPLGADQSERAKTLWYSAAVEQAVEAAGRRVVQGEVSFEGASGAPVSPVTIALHDSDEVFRGALVAAVDLSGFSARVDRITGGRPQVTLRTGEGRMLEATGADSSGAPMDPNAGGPSLNLNQAPETAFEWDGQLVLARRLGETDPTGTPLWALVGFEAPDSAVLAWLASPLPITLVLLGAMSVWTLRGGRFENHEPAVSTSSVADASSSHPSPPIDSAPPIEGEPEPVVLREWLADVRSCLEREAATRGLALDVRCARSIPRELRTDAAWLGGLLVAMGREALDATSEDRVSVAVLGDEGRDLRVEIDAGGVALTPIAGMEEVAASVGARFELGTAAGFTLIVPAALA
jgi:hypothetical protein